MCDVQFSSHEENYIFPIEVILHLETKYSKLIAPWDGFNLLFLDLTKDYFPEPWLFK